MATKRAAEAAETEVETIKAQSAAAIQPWITRIDPSPRQDEPPAMPRGGSAAVHEGAEGATIEVYVTNMGKGIALLGEATVIGRTSLGERVTRKMRPFLAVLAPGQETSIRFTVKGHDYEPFSFFHTDQTSGEFAVHVPYTDVNGEQAVMARVHIVMAPGSAGWAFHRIDYHRDEEKEPFASAAFEGSVPNALFGAT